MRRGGQEEAGEEDEDEEQVEGPMDEKDTLVHTFAFILLNQLISLLQLQRIWWLQVVAAVEMNRTGSQDRLDVVKQLKQLFGYLRQILHRQLDRRFIFGLTLGLDMMTVWLHDRSGVIGTKTAIDIHKVGE